MLAMAFVLVVIVFAWTLRLIIWRWFPTLL
jgi:hypothetical protein